MPSRHSLAVAGLTTTVIPMSTAGVFSVDVKLQLPTLSEGASADSAVICTIKQNASTLYTSKAGDEGAHTTVNITAGDTVTVITASAASVDQDPNIVKATIAIG